MSVHLYLGGYSNNDRPADLLQACDVGRLALVQSLHARYGSADVGTEQCVATTSKLVSCLDIWFSNTSEAWEIREQNEHCDANIIDGYHANKGDHHLCPLASACFFASAFSCATASPVCGTFANHAGGVMPV